MNIQRLKFMVELAQWLAKQEYLIDIEEQIEAMNRIISDLKEEEQKQLKGVRLSATPEVDN